MAAYLIAQVTIHDWAEYEKYVTGFMDALAPFEGRLLAVAEKVEVIEGTWPQARTVVIEFPSMEKARDWYQSPKYQAIAQHRFKAATTNLVLAPGFEPPKA